MWRAVSLLVVSLIIHSASAFGPHATLSRSSLPVRSAQPFVRAFNPSIDGIRFNQFETRLGASAITTETVGGRLWTMASNGKAYLHSDPSFVLSSILLLTMVGIFVERRTTIGKALSANIVTMALALLIANLGFIPFASPVYTIVNKSLVPLAVPLFLFDSDLRRIIRDTGPLLVAFMVGAFSTIVGTLVAFPLFPMKALGIDQGWRVASALAARHIGGAINFVAVAETLSVESSAVSAAIAADNVVVAIYFSFLFFIAKNGEDFVETELKRNEIELSVTDPESVEDGNERSGMSLTSLGSSLCLASCLVTLGKMLTSAILPKGTSSLPLISMLTVTAATIYPKFFSSLVSSGAALGVLMMQMFFAVSGAAGSIGQVFQRAPSLFLFSALQIAVHFVCLNLIGRTALGLDRRDLYLASNANVGGPTTAAAMAKGKQWPSRVLPALMIGVLGYASATAIALALGPVLVRIVS